MSIAIGICLILLILVLIASIITLTVYVVKWLIEFTILTKTLNDTTVVVKRKSSGDTVKSSGDSLTVN